MGTDIHLFVEKRVNGKWLSCDKWTTDREDYYDGPYKNVSYKDRYYDDRNYDVFAMLADVRNGSGFAGCDTGDGFNPIAMPKGYPDDMSDEVREYVSQYTEHTPTWISLRELLEYDWNQVTNKRGVVALPEYYWWKYKKNKTCEPYSYCGGVSGPGVEHLSPFEMDELIDNLSPDQRKRLDEFVKDPKWGRTFKLHDEEPDEVGKKTDYYTVAEWTETYRESAGNFYTETLPKLQALCSSGNPDDIRLVFYFDS